MQRFIILLLLISIRIIALAERDNENERYLTNDITKYTIERNSREDHLVTNSGLKSSYQCITEIGYGIKITDNGYNFLKAYVINGFRINPLCYLGIGTGMNLYFDNHALFNTFAAYPVIPFFADLRVKFGQKDVAMYSSLDMGYAFDASDSFKRFGFLINPAAGLDFKISDKLWMNTGIGYDLQFVDSENNENSNSNFGAISIKIGLSF